VSKALAPIAVLVAAALAVAGCGSSSTETGGAYGGSSSTTTSTTASSTPATASGAVVSVAVTPKLGKAIVDPEGFTLYDFHKDKGTTSACYGGCAKVWAPLLTEGKPQVGEGAMASKLGTTTRKDGTTQVTYSGHPVYTYVGDKKPGDTTGNDFSSFGAQWYALSPSGEELGS
jgi:predicted lipoprotein with Yx(FWY)xxD motif